MLLSLVSHLLCAWFAFVLPSYATYKALVHTPSPDILHPLAAYWAVIGVFVAFEQTLGLLFSWLPFYWELRTIFLLYVSLPQTQGAAYVYKSLLEPFFANNEADIDASLTSAQTNALTFCRARVASLVDLVWSFLNKSAVSLQSSHAADPHKPAHPVDQLGNLWNTYAPSVLTALVSKDVNDTTTTNSASAERVHEPYLVS